MISDTIQKQIQQALKSHDELRQTTLRLLSASLHNAQIDKRAKLSEEEEIIIVQKEVKKRIDAIVLYKRGGALDRAKREEAEIIILKEFLPEEITAGELEKIVNDTILQLNASSLSDMGKVIGAIKSKVGARAQGAVIAQLVKEKLSEVVLKNVN